MPNPNLIDSRSIHGLTRIANVTSNRSTVLENNTSANTVFKIENISAVVTDSSANAAVTIELYDYTTNTSANLIYRQIVRSNTYSSLITRKDYIYLEERDQIRAYSNANCNVFVVYEMVSTQNDVLDLQTNTYSFPNIITSSSIYEYSDSILLGGSGNIYVNSLSTRPNVVCKLNNLTIRNLGGANCDIFFTYYSNVRNTNTLLYANTIGPNNTIQLIDQEKYLYIPQGDYLTYTYPSISESEYANVYWLMKGDGAEGSKVITDLSPYNRVISVGANANISASIRKFGSGSLRLHGPDGTANIYAPGNPPIPAAPNGAFTLEAWVYLLSSGRHCLLGEPSGNAFATAWGAGIWDTNGPYGGDSVTKGLCWILSPNNGYGGNMVYSGQYPNLNQWTHVAIVRTSNGNWLFFMDGVLGTTYNANQETHPFSQFPTNNGPTGAMSIKFWIGEFNGILSGGNSSSMPAGFNGYIDDYRLTVGSARYTTSFTPPVTTFPSSSILSVNNTLSLTTNYNLIMEAI